MRPLVAALLAVLLSFGLAACTSGQTSSAEDFQGEQRNVASALEDLEEAAADREYARICQALLSEKLGTAIGKGNRNNCVAEIEDVVDDADRGQIDVQRVTITGNRATAEVEQRDNNADERVTVSLVKEGGSWRLDDLARVPVD